MHSQAIVFIQDLAVIMIVAGLITVLCHRFKQPIVLGYIIAGIIVGPHTPPFALISDERTIRTLAELGVIFLMFSLGLEFNLHKLSRVGATAGIAVVLEIAVMISLGYAIGRMFDWSQINSIFLGAILSISSTTIIVKALDELGMKNEFFAHLIFGILILEDIFAILILALLSSIALTGSLQLNEVIITATKLSSFLVVSLLIGILLVPRLLSYIVKFQSREMLLISVLGLCFGFCLFVIKLQYSVALGAFIIGAIIAESNQLERIERLILPIRDMFSAIFFVSVGLLFDPNVVLQYLAPIIIITIAVVIGKIVSASLGVLLSGYNGKTAVRVGMGLAQIGEFSFIIASLGISLKVTGNFLYSIAVTVSIITTLLTPYLIKYSDTFTRYARELIPRKFMNSLRLYANWMQHFQPDEIQVKRVQNIKQYLTQIVLNLFLVIAIFLCATYVAKTGIGYALTEITDHYMQKTIVWGIALLFSLPFLIVIFRKIRALSVLLAQLDKKETVQARHIARVKKIMARMIPIIAIIAIMVMVSILSASILPPIEMLFVVLIIVAILLPLLFPWFLKIHAKLQISLFKSIKKKNEKK